MSLDRRIAPDPYDYLPPVAGFTLTSDDIVGGTSTQLRHVHGSAGGENLSPQLSWADVPEGTQSFVVTCFDPDAPTPSGFWHWCAVDLPGDTRSLDRGAGTSDATLPPSARWPLAHNPLPNLLRPPYHRSSAASVRAGPQSGPHPQRFILAVENP